MHSHFLSKVAPSNLSSLITLCVAVMARPLPSQANAFNKNMYRLFGCTKRHVQVVSYTGFLRFTTCPNLSPLKTVFFDAGTGRRPGVHLPFLSKWQCQRLKVRCLPGHPLTLQHMPTAEEKLREMKEISPKGRWGKPRSTGFHLYYFWHLGA